MNLIDDSWIPVRCQSGKRIKIAPWQLTENNDPIIAIHSPRHDFDGALMQFLIGLFQTTFDSLDDTKWLNWFEGPPGQQELKEGLERYRQAFEIKSFMQDFDPLDSQKLKNISALLIDSPGENTLKKNTDHFVKGGKIEALCPICTIAALFTLQTNSPSGGVGYRTSVRGGGPLTTLAVLDETTTSNEDFLWQNVWLNVLDKEYITNNKNALKDIFPWLAPTRTSEKGKETEKTTPEDASFFQTFWGMPRRIRIDWSDANSGDCDLCGDKSERLVHQFWEKNYGVNYEGPWQHPLTPYGKDKKGQKYPIKMKRRGIVYTDWPDLIFNSSNSSEQAPVIKRYLEKSEQWKEQFRLHAFGYDMDKAKARCWYDIKLPLFKVGEDVEFTKDIRYLTDISLKCTEVLAKEVKEAWFYEGKKKKGDISFLKHDFWQKTEDFFFKQVKEFQGAELEERQNIKRNWGGALRKEAIGLFDLWVPWSDLCNLKAMKGIASARKRLENKLNKITKV
ncbi:MAG: type I-E CRISPR-associated protein Cse1/CasA [Bacteriovoracales bacterium]|nr:type I-E CRISPR-associated protein Cse1/CasA [Bacteriovoracales bacterium]